MAADDPQPRALFEILKTWQQRLFLQALSEVLRQRYGSVRIIIVDGKISKIVAEISYDASRPVDNLK